MKQKYLRCKVCGNIVEVVNESGVPMMCCGQKMEEIIPGTVEASVEKHVPVYEIKGNEVHVSVGSVDHPMIPEHYIEWVSIQTKQGSQRKYLTPNHEPKVIFQLVEGDELESVYAYCNLHGLWKVER